MNIKRKSISMLLIVVLITTMAVPAFALDKEPEFDVYQFNVVTVADENYVIVDMSVNCSYFVMALVERGYSVIPIPNDSLVNSVKTALEEMAFSIATENAIDDFQEMISDTVTYYQSISSFDAQAVSPFDIRFINTGYNRAVVPVTIVNVNRTAAINAIYDWNGFFSTHGRLVSVTTNTQNQIIAADLRWLDAHAGGNMVVGHYISRENLLMVQIHRSVRFDIQICHRIDPQINSNRLRGMIAHEIGHAFGLNELSGPGTIMDSTRITNTFFRPQQVDADLAHLSWTR